MVNFLLVASFLNGSFAEFGNSITCMYYDRYVEQLAVEPG